jgi:hypothetical protein
MASAAVATSDAVSPHAAATQGAAVDWTAAEFEHWHAMLKTSEQPTTEAAEVMQGTFQGC